MAETDADRWTPEAGEHIFGEHDIGENQKRVAEKKKGQWEKKSAGASARRSTETSVGRAEKSKINQ